VLVGHTYFCVARGCYDPYGLPGVHVTLHPPGESEVTRRRYKTGFIICGVISVGLVVTQGFRNRQSVNAMNRDMADLAQGMTAAKTESQEAKEGVKNESVRRQQAESDLKILIDASSKATRIGIAEDLRKTPLKAIPSKVDTPEKKHIREVLGTFVQEGMKLRDRLDKTPAPVIEPEAQQWFEKVQVYLNSTLGSSYVSQFLLTNVEQSPSLIPTDNLSVWHGLNERIQTLNKFIDELK
jgi:hypothetical protein